MKYLTSKQRNFVSFLQVIKDFCTSFFSCLGVLGCMFCTCVKWPLKFFFLPISIVVLCVSNEIQSRIEKYASCGEVFVYGTTSCLFMGQLQLL